MTRTTKSELEAQNAVGGVALIASILANLQQHSRNDGLTRSVVALQRVIQDWQVAYRNLDAQLELAMRTNDEQRRLIDALRNEAEELRERSYRAEQRALEAETAALQPKRRKRA